MTSKGARSTIASDQPCIARQPILDAQGNVFGYELLFRQSASVQSCERSTDDASARVMVDAILSIGLDTLTGGKRAFINLSHDILLSDATMLLPREHVVIELVEDIQHDDDILEVCSALSRSGYALALDDVVATETVAKLFPLVDYIKVDFRGASTPAARASVIDALPAKRPKLVAEKVETPQEFGDAADEGFTYFQGYYFGRPATRQVKRIAPRRGAYAALLVKLNEPDISVSDLESVIKQDASLSYRVLRALNSASTPLRVEITSIRQAIILLGRDTIRRWASLWTMAAINEAAHPELVASSIIRARCCEMIDASSSTDPGNGFLLGMFSLLDVMLEQPMSAVLTQLPLDASVRAALLGEQNPRRALLDCVIAYERGDWERYDQLATRAGTSSVVLRTAYNEALRWMRDLNAAA